jgi:signal transduction histidine kinase
MSDDPQKAPRSLHSTLLMDIVIIMVLAAVIFLASLFTNLADMMIRPFGTTISPLLGSILVVALFLSVALIAFAYRRWTDVTHISDECAQTERLLESTHAKLLFINNITRYDMLNELTRLHKDLEETGSTPQTARVEETINRIRRQIKFTKEYQDIGAVPPTWQNLADAIMRAKVGLDLGNVSFEMDIHDIEVYADPLLEKVFFYMISNSMKYGGSNLTKIRIYKKKADDRLTIICEDNGVGIAQEQKAFLFPKEWGSRKHAGYGLFLIRETLAVTGISIFESGRPGDGAKFEITVPKGVFRQV